MYSYQYAHKKYVLNLPLPFPTCFYFTVNVTVVFEICQETTTIYGINSLFFTPLLLEHPRIQKLKRILKAVYSGLQWDTGNPSFGTLTGGYMQLCLNTPSDGSSLLYRLKQLGISSLYQARIVSR